MITHCWIESSDGALRLGALDTAGVIVANAAGRFPLVSPRLGYDLGDLDVPSHAGSELGTHVDQINVARSNPEVPLLHMLHRLQTETGHQHLARLLLRSNADGCDAVTDDGQDEHHHLHRVDPVGEKGSMIGAVIEVVNREVLDAPQRRTTGVLQDSVEQLGGYPIATIARGCGRVGAPHGGLHLAGNRAAERYMGSTRLMRGLIPG